MYNTDINLSATELWDQNYSRHKHLTIYAVYRGRCSAVRISSEGCLKFLGAAGIFLAKAAACA